MVERLQFRSFKNITFLKYSFPQFEISKFDRILFIKRTYTGFQYVRMNNQNMMRKLFSQRLKFTENL